MPKPCCVWETHFSPQDKVFVDGDETMKFTVVGIYITQHGVDYDLAWVHDGNFRNARVDGFRLTVARHG